jgi:hypothetical protein
MSRFYASIQGQADAATRRGSASSGITGHVRGWQVGVEVVGEDEDGRDVFHVYGTGGGKGGTSRELIATIREPEPRYAPCAVFSATLGTVWRVRDRNTNTYVPTMPRTFMARESAQASADNLNAA